MKQQASRKLAIGAATSLHIARYLITVRDLETSLELHVQAAEVIVSEQRRPYRLPKHIPRCDH